MKRLIRNTHVLIIEYTTDPADHDRMPDEHAEWWWNRLKDPQTAIEEFETLFTSWRENGDNPFLRVRHVSSIDDVFVE